MAGHSCNATDESDDDDGGEDVDSHEFASLVTTSRLSSTALEHLWLAATLECTIAFGSWGQDLEGHASWRLREKPELRSATALEATHTPRMSSVHANS